LLLIALFFTGLTFNGIQQADFWQCDLSLALEESSIDVFNDGIQKILLRVLYALNTVLVP
jgi:hypothetical protein